MILMVMCMAIVMFCKSGFRPLPFVITKFAVVGLKGFSIKLMIIKKKSCTPDKVINTHGNPKSI